MDYQAKKGYFFIVVFTFSLTDDIVLLSSGLASTVLIISTISPMRLSLAPRVVIAGVPKRRPEVWNGDLSSKGTIFLFTVISAFTNIFSPFLPVKCGNFDRKSTSMI